MNSNHKEYLTKEKQAGLITELDQLKTVARQAIARELDFAKSLGDLSENTEYHEARDKQADIEDRIKQLEHILKHVVTITSHHTTQVEIGSTATVKKLGGQAETYLIVGSEEADMASGKISHQSPLGSALMDKKTGDQVTVQTPKGDIIYTIVEIK